MTDYVFQTFMIIIEIFKTLSYPLVLILEFVLYNGYLLMRSIYEAMILFVNGYQFRNKMMKISIKKKWLSLNQFTFINQFKEKKCCYKRKCLTLSSSNL